jgi:hypothetical protein
MLGLLASCTAAAIPTDVPTSAAMAVLTAVPTSTSTPGLTVTPTATPEEPAASPNCPLGPADSGSADGDPELYTVIGVADGEQLTMHTCPGTSEPVVRVLEPYSVGLRRGGQDREAEGLSWTPVYGGDVGGWVQSRYLARQYGEADPSVAARAGQIVAAFRDQDWAAVASSVHPDEGVLLSPYAYVQEGADLVFSADQFAGLAEDETVYRWGVFDGSGKPIEMTFLDYYARFIYDADFAWPSAVGFNEFVGAGNTIDNLAEVYPQARVVEFHLPGSDPRYGGMDWRSLRLALEQVGETWYLVAVVHDEWTI